MGFGGHFGRQFEKKTHFRGLDFPRLLVRCKVHQNLFYQNQLRNLLLHFLGVKGVFSIYLTTTFPLSLVTRSVNWRRFVLCERVAGMRFMPDSEWWRPTIGRCAEWSRRRMPEASRRELTNATCRHSRYALRAISSLHKQAPAALRCCCWCCSRYSSA